MINLQIPPKHVLWDVYPSKFKTKGVPLSYYAKKLESFSVTGFLFAEFYPSFIF